MCKGIMHKMSDLRLRNTEGETHKHIILMSVINMNAEIYTQKYIIHMHRWSYHLISCSFVLPHEAIVYS